MKAAGLFRKPSISAKDKYSGPLKRHKLSIMTKLGHNIDYTSARNVVRPNPCGDTSELDKVRTSFKGSVLEGVAAQPDLTPIAMFFYQLCC